MCLLLREAMSVGRILLHESFFSTELAPHEAKNRIKDELNNYCVVTEAPKSSFGKSRKTCVISPFYGTTQVAFIFVAFSGTLESCTASRTTSASRYNWRALDVKRCTLVPLTHNFTHTYVRLSLFFVQFWQDSKYRNFR